MIGDVGGIRTDVDRLATEQARPELADLDCRDAGGLVDALLAAEARVPQVMAAARSSLAEAVTLAEEALAAGGRVVYAGAGTPGRLAAQDAAEVPPTYGVDPHRVVAVLAGGEAASGVAVEGAEDDAAAGAHAVTSLAVGGDDLVVGITASGRTPYVLGALDAARNAGAATVAIVNNRPSLAAARADVVVELLTGAEVVAGSTRLAAGTAQKIALNIVSTGAMVRLGHTYGAWMVGVQASNDKLRRRANRIVRDATGADRETAARALVASGGNTRVALVALLGGIDADAARARLEAAGGRVREAVEGRSP